MLSRTLEPELMDTFQEASEYDAMDHSEVNRLFVADFWTAWLRWGGGEGLRNPGLLPLSASVLEFADLGTGTAQIPIELCKRHQGFVVWGLDDAAHMLNFATSNIEIAGLTHRIRVDKADAKQLPFSPGRFAAIISNSIVHHIPEPLCVLKEACRVIKPGGVLFFRDLARPRDETELARLVRDYAGGASEFQQKMFSDSLRAALSLEEVRELIGKLGFPASTATLTSDRHWTWSAKMPAA